MSDISTQSAGSGWLTVTGETDHALAAELSRLVSEKVAAGKIKPQELVGVARAELKLIRQSFDFEDTHLERLRRLCQLWELELKPAPITSHRKFIGPIIIAVKRMVFPILRVFLKETVKQQREFNAEVIHLLADLSSRREH